VNRPPAPPVAAHPVPTPPPNGGAAPGNNALELQYQNEKTQMEVRHRTEFTRPPAGETQENLTARQEAEHRELDTRYQTARTQGLKTLPPPKPANEKKK
jgi:hypothetical protein